MAEIRRDGIGVPPVVVLNDEDRKKLVSSLKWVCREREISVSAFAEKIGVGRQKVYSLLNANEIELQRFIVLQKELRVSLLDRFQIQEYLIELEATLTTPEFFDGLYEKRHDYFEDRFILNCKTDILEHGATQ